MKDMNMDNKESKKVKIILGGIFFVMFLASIACFVAMSVTGNYFIFFLIGFVLLGVSVMVLLNPYLEIGKTFFKDFVFKKRNKK